MAGALEGLRVVDFGHYVAGPLTALLLADQGADVIRIDRPGSPEQGFGDFFYNRNKRRVTLDLKTMAGRAAAAALVADADVVIENFRPGVMAGFGLDGATLRARDGRLIYCSLPGFAACDPRAAMPAWEGIVQAASSGYRTLDAHYYTDTATIVMHDPSRPLFNRIPLASNLAAMLAATSIVMALIARQRSGRGQTVEIPLFEAMIEALNMRVDFPDFGLASPPGTIVGKFICADGRFLDLMAHPFRFVEWLIADQGLDEQWRAEGLLDRDRLTADPDHAAHVQQRLCDLFRTRPAHDWEADAARLSIPLALVQSPDEWLRSDVALASGAVVRLDDPILGDVLTAGAAVQLGGTRAPLAPRGIPSAEIPTFGHGLKSALPSDTADGLRRPLEGVSVVDITTQVAGPTAARLLADFGAEVIKINHPSTDALIAHVNRGKKTALVDFQSPEGRDILLRLVERSDVLLQNLVQGADERYGFGEDIIRRINPGIIYSAVSAYPHQGPWGGRRGYEMEGQASAGIASDYAGPDHWPLNHPMLVNDVGTGILAAFGTAAALFARGGTALGTRVNASLAQTATIHQAGYLAASPGPAGLTVEPQGLEVFGWHPLQRLYRASDGWFFLGARRDQRADILTAGGILPSPARSDDDLALQLAQLFIMRPVEAWRAAFAPVAVAVHAVIASSIDAAAHPALETRGVVVHERGATGGVRLHPAIGPWLSETPPQAGATTSRFGEDTAEVVRRAGLGDQLEELLETGVIAYDGPVTIGA
jgi:crotonobetainyl-CoA:carnitine CoA-transferase CaiB-like acyl-CoA transferase